MVYELNKLMNAETGFQLVGAQVTANGQQKTFAFDNKEHHDIKLQVTRPYLEDIVEPAELQLATEQDLQAQVSEWASEAYNGQLKNINVADLPALVREIAIELISRGFDLAYIKLESGIFLSFIRGQGKNRRFTGYYIEWRPSAAVVQALLPRWATEDVQVEMEQVTLHADGVTVNRVSQE